MRSLAVLAPLLFSGCVLLTPVVPGPAIVPLPSGGIDHAGYILVCEGVAIEACRGEADLIASQSGRGHQIRSIIVRADGYELCWEGPVAGICEGATTAAATPSGS